jgi:hypothetical protein
VGWNRVLIKVRNGTSNSGLKAVRFSNADATVWSGSTLTYAVDDTTAPNNPTTCTESGGAADGVWQSTVSTPSFSWSGAADTAGTGEGASGVRGYKVYFGTSSSGDPSSSTIQTGTTYSPGAQSDGTYYLRVSTVDNAMNVSMPTTLFTFQYDHTAPAGVSMGFGTIATDSIAVTGTGTDANSGINASTGYNYSRAGASDSGAKGTTHIWTGLVPNTDYTGLLVTVSDQASPPNTAASSPQSAWTLSVPPGGSSATPDTLTMCSGNPVTWTAASGFGAGTIQKYKYAWDQSPAHTWTESELDWSTGTIQTTPTAAGTWYLHVKGYNGATPAVGNGTYDYPVTVNARPASVVRNADSATICNGSSTTIHADLTGTGPWNVTWSDSVQQNGVATTPATRNVNPSATTTHTVTALTDANCTAQAEDLTGSAAITVNQPPTAPNKTFTRAPGLSLKITVADLGAADPESGTVTFNSVTGGSQNATISHDDTYIFYLPQAGNNTGDSFNYTTTDGQCVSVSGTITVNVAGQPGAASGQISVSGGVATVKMFGIPGLQYDVQRSADNMNTWTTLATPPLGTTPVSASTADGSITFTDDFSDLSGPPDSAYYRIVAH